MTPLLFLPAYSIAPTNSGIGRVALLTARVISELVTSDELRADGVVLMGAGGTPSPGVMYRSANGSRARYVAAVARAQFTHDAMIYDCAGMARAHGWLPYPRRPFLTWVHGIEFWRGTAHAKQVAAAKRSRQLVANSHYTVSRAVDYEPSAARATVCWLATETDDPPGRPKQMDGPPRVMILSRVDAQSYKGHSELLRAWPLVRASVPGAVLTIAGSGPGLDEQKRLASSLGLDDRSVEFRGFVPEASVDDLWAETTVFAMPSRGEGFGLVYIEAMRWGIPVVASTHDAGQEVNVDGRTGYNVSLDRPHELPDRLIHLLKNRDHAAAFGAAGRDRWHAHFRFSAFRDRFVPILRGFLAPSTFGRGS